MTVKIDWIAGNCPVEAEGTVDGEPFYFRARGEHWSMSIGGDPVGDPAWELRRDYPGGEWAAGWMPETEALEFIEIAAGLWRIREPQQ